MSLRNDSSLSAESAYSEPDADPSLKIAPNDDVARLLAGWRALGFFEAAQPVALDQAQATLTVRLNGQVSVLSRLPVAMSNVDDVTRFNNCVDVFRHVYDGVQSYHTNARIQADDFERQNMELLQNAHNHGRGQR